MRAFLWFIGLFVAGFAVIALLAWPAYEWLSPMMDVKFHRLANRIGQLSLLVGFMLVARRLALADRRSLGFGLPRGDFLRELTVGLALGVATMLPVALVMVGLDLRVLREGVTLDAALVARLALSGLATGLVVGLVEETFLRGAMHTAIARESGARTAIILTALLYSAVHFVGRFRIPVEQLGPDAGLRHIAGTLAAFADPAGIADAFLALAAVGVLLGMVRAITGNIAACIGLHAGWVWVIAFLRETSVPDETSPLRFLLSRFDGVVGWLVLAWTLVIGLVVHRFYARRALRRARPDAQAS
ncbi:MAG: CPBP family intramembrane metalloprotease [Gammaproteobacteria bacterium]|nr:CPBP family intramembrane metalloprotease [Gammaproteobacteria bacterium]